MGHISPTIIAWLTTYGYVVLLPIAILEGPIISVIAGFFVSVGQMNFWIVFAILVLGDLIGDFILYGIGRWGGRSFIERWGGVFGVTEARLAKFEALFQKNATKALLFGKWGHAFGAPILMSAGATREPLGEFFRINTIGTIPKTLLLIAIGFYFGAAYALIDTYLFDALLIMTMLGIVAGVLYWTFNERARHYFAEEEAQ
jgi:membrane protein DedA with SNARE-associated domain